MSRDFDFEKNVSLLMQKKIIRNRQTALTKNIKELKQDFSTLESMADFIQMNSTREYLRECREFVIAVNRAVNRAQITLKELKKARVEIMRIKNG